MSMYFYEDTDDWPEYRMVKDDILRLEKTRVKARKELNNAEVALKSDPNNENLKGRVDGLKKKLNSIEKTLNESLNMYR